MAITKPYIAKEITRIVHIEYLDNGDFKVTAERHQRLFDNSTGNIIMDIASTDKVVIQTVPNAQAVSVMNPLEAAIDGWSAAQG